MLRLQITGPGLCTLEMLHATVQQQVLKILLKIFKMIIHVYDCIHVGPM
jgi:hypothetical protein